MRGVAIADRGVMNGSVLRMENLNWLVICTDPKSRKWVDSLGNEVK